MTRVLLVWMATLAVGCSSATEPEREEERMIGIVVGFEGDLHLVVPDTVRVGEDFTVSVRTYWRNTCSRKDDTEVEVEGLVATLTPYDIIMGGEVCGQAIQTFTHAATLQFDEPGRARMIVRGRELPGPELVTFERTVTVR